MEQRGVSSVFYLSRAQQSFHNGITAVDEHIVVDDIVAHPADRVGRIETHSHYCDRTHRWGFLTGGYRLMKAQPPPLAQQLRSSGLLEKVSP